MVVGAGAAPLAGAWIIWGQISPRSAAAEKLTLITANAEHYVAEIARVLAPRDDCSARGSCSTTSAPRLLGRSSPSIIQSATRSWWIRTRAQAPSLTHGTGRRPSSTQPGWRSTQSFVVRGQGSPAQPPRTSSAHESGSDAILQTLRPPRTPSKPRQPKPPHDRHAPTSLNDTTARRPQAAMTKTVRHIGPIGGRSAGVRRPTSCAHD
jgi:hypothetical protein